MDRCLPSVGRVCAALSTEQPVLRYMPKHEELKHTFGRSAVSSLFSSFAIGRTTMRRLEGSGERGGA